MCKPFQAFVFFATHFSDLTQLDCYANVHNFHLSAPAGTAESTAAAGAREGGNTAGYKLSKGTFDGVTYGLDQAGRGVDRSGRRGRGSGRRGRESGRRGYRARGRGADGSRRHLHSLTPSWPDYVRMTGIRLAAATGFPATVVEEARAISEQVRTWWDATRRLGVGHAHELSRAAHSIDRSGHARTQLTARARQVSGSGDSEAVRAELRLRKHRQQVWPKESA